MARQNDIVDAFYRDVGYTLKSQLRFHAHQRYQVYKQWALAKASSLPEAVNAAIEAEIERTKENVLSAAQERVQGRRKFIEELTASLLQVLEVEGVAGASKIRSRPALDPSVVLH